MGRGFQFTCVEDVGLPFMTDPRWEGDTLFMVFEEDWRLFRAGGEPEFKKKEDLECVAFDGAPIRPGEQAAQTFATQCFRTVAFGQIERYFRVSGRCTSVPCAVRGVNYVTSGTKIGATQCPNAAPRGCSAWRPIRPGCGAEAIFRAIRRRPQRR